MSDFKKEWFDAIKQGKPEKAVDMYFNHMQKMRFLQQCHIVLHPSMKHRVGLPTDFCVNKKDGGYFALWHCLDWVTQKLLIQTYPNSPLEGEIQLNLERCFREKQRGK